MRHLLHPRVLQRLIDAAEYGNTYGIDEHMNALTDAIFKADLRSSVNTQRQQLQIEYVKSLVSALDPKAKYDVITQSMVLSDIEANSARSAKRFVAERTDPSAPRSHHLPHSKGLGSVMPIRLKNCGELKEEMVKSVSSFFFGAYLELMFRHSLSTLFS